MDAPTRGLSRALAAAFGGDASRAEVLAKAIAADAHDPEASLRIEGGTVRGGRMMLERARPDAARQIAAGLGLDWIDEAEALVAGAQKLSLPLIAGWDVGAASPLYKVYANAADASSSARRELREIAGLSPALPDAQIVGINVSSEAHATKLYVQRPSLSDLVKLGYEGLVPEALAAVDGVAWVASHDVDGDETSIRALFVATRHGHEAGAQAALRILTGLSWAELRGEFPFPPGPLRQLGVSPEGAVTVYAKPEGGAAPVHALAPIAVFRAGPAEVGLYVTPSDDTPRAFARVGGRALTFRTREGTPASDDLALLGAWAESRVVAARGEAAIPSALWDAPPAPWSRVHE